MNQKQPYYNKNRIQKKDKFNLSNKQKVTETIQKFANSEKDTPYKELVERFPKCELSYGQLDHTKVQYNLYAAIPAGKKK